MMLMNDIDDGDADDDLTTIFTAACNSFIF